MYETLNRVVAKKKQIEVTAGVCLMKPHIYEWTPPLVLSEDAACNHTPGGRICHLYRAKCGCVNGTFLRRYLP